MFNSEKCDQSLRHTPKIRTDPEKVTGAARLAQFRLWDVLQRPIGVAKWDRFVLPTVNYQGWLADRPKHHGTHGVGSICQSAFTGGIALIKAGDLIDIFFGEFTYAIRRIVG